MEISQEEVKKLGESQTVEFKKSLSLIKEACEALCGMINSDLATGQVIFGISPDNSICGIEPGNLDTAQRTIAQHIKQKFDPHIICIIEVLECGDIHLLQVRAERMSGVPYHEYGGRAYIREGTTTRKLTYQEKQNLIKKPKPVPLHNRESLIRAIVNIKEKAIAVKMRQDDLNIKRKHYENPQEQLTRRDNAWFAYLDAEKEVQTERLIAGNLFKEIILGFLSFIEYHISDCMGHITYKDKHETIKTVPFMEQLEDSTERTIRELDAIISQIPDKEGSQNQ